MRGLNRARLGTRLARQGCFLAGARLRGERKGKQNGSWCSAAPILHTYVCMYIRIVWTRQGRRRQCPGSRPLGGTIIDIGKGEEGGMEVSGNRESGVGG